jgi:hypothetical protein
LALVRDVRGDALAFADVRQQRVGHGQLGQLRFGQRHQLLAQGQHLQRFAPVLAAAGAQKIPGFFVSTTHRKIPVFPIQRSEPGVAFAARSLQSHFSPGGARGTTVQG